MEQEKNKVNFDDLVSETAQGLSMDKVHEKELAKKYLNRKENVFSNTNITPDNQSVPDTLENIFFNQTHKGEKLEISGLSDINKVSQTLTTELKPISDIFNLARDMVKGSKRVNIKDNFYQKEEIQIKNENLVARSLFFSTLITFLIVAGLFALFKNRMIMIASVFTMAGALLSGMLYVNKKEKLTQFNMKKFSLLDDDINEIKIRLKKTRDDISYYEAIRKMQDLPNFEIEFSTKVNHVIDLINEYEHIEKTDVEKKDRYYKEIIKTFEEMTNYEKNTYDKYFHEKMKAL